MPSHATPCREAQSRHTLVDMTRSVRGPVACSTIALVLLTGCTGAPSDAGSTAPPPSPSSSRAPAATESAAPAIEIACNTIVPPSRRDYLTNIGLAETPAADFFTKVRSEVAASPYLLMEDNGGVVCAWGAHNEYVQVYGYSPLTSSQVAEAESLIVATNDNYASTAHTEGTLWTTEMDGNPFTYFLVANDGLYVATSTEMLDEMIARVS